MALAAELSRFSLLWRAAQLSDAAAAAAAAAAPAYVYDAADSPDAADGAATGDNSAASPPAWTPMVPGRSDSPDTSDVGSSPTASPPPAAAAVAQSARELEPAGGVPMLLALDALQHPRRRCARRRRWLCHASAQPQTLLTPLLALLLAPAAAPHLRVYALDKLRALVAAFPPSTVPKLSDLTAPPALVTAAAAAAARSPLPAGLPAAGASLLELLAAVSLLLVLEPQQRRRA